jgi:rod shape-determining protein MreC
MTVDGEVYGIVEPRLSAGGEALLALTGVPFHTELDDGVLIVTSGRGGVYPRGIPIGAVSGMEESDAGWRKSYLLRPLVGPAEMTHVLILGEAEQGAADQDLAASWGVLPPEPRVDTLAPGTTPPAGGAAGAAPAAPAATPAQPRREPRLLGVPVQPSPAPPDTGRNGQGRR